MDFSVENLCGFLIRSKLMTADEMQAMRQRWLTEAKDAAGQVPVFLRWIVSNHYVTEYQAALLSRGHADDFFLGPYKILERIGRGRMAGVYKAIHPSGQIVAIKVLPPSRARNRELLARFQREARLAVKLKHTHVVRTFQCGAAGSVHHLVMEYLDGETVEEMLLRRKRLPAAEAVRLAYQALLGLQHLHEQGLVHRDLKPANLMLLPAPARGDNETTLKSNIKILDIGLAREFFDENSPAPSAEPLELTAEGVLLGTPDYLAPEQARDPRSIDIRADIYSVGCVLYHLLTGQPPFPDKNILNQMIRHATEAPRPLAEFNPSAPAGLQQIVDRMLAKQPEERFATPLLAAQALQGFMVSNEGMKPGEESPQMRRYLTWLETADGAGVPLAKRVTVPATTGARTPLHSSKPTGERQKRRTNLKIAPPIPAAKLAPPLPVANSVPPSADQVDVELVDATPGFRLARRDMIMLAIGAAVILSGLGVWFVVSLVR